MTLNTLLRPLGLALVFFTLVSCGSDDAGRDYTGENDQEIRDYISENNLNAVKSDTGLYYVVTNPGNEGRPTPTDNVTVAYRGYFTNGNVFDQSGPEGISFNLNQVIAGWTEGITYFGEGGEGVLLIPSRLGYGNAGRGSIPGGAVLVFDISLLSIN
ncbi:FKBP-type peptidyl-prolyl cis-trans isomerase [Maribacter sp. 2307ULW6-5]|uniref:FKBP-type peptidyl-prolyl cis-trans isomerase n=1 Tax=Maribacter sp. 2307ULW6-5 TaxID=3386275 RepID=UPI0039BD4D8F